MSCCCVRRLSTTILGRWQETATVTLSIPGWKCTFTWKSAFPSRSEMIQCSGCLGLCSGSLGACNQCRKCELVLSPSIRNDEMKCWLKKGENQGEEGVSSVWDCCYCCDYYGLLSLEMQWLERYLSCSGFFYQLSFSAASSQVGKVTMALCLSLPYKPYHVIKEEMQWLFKHRKAQWCYYYS